ncbi:MAG: hypothetical protein ACXACI_06060 [Candidatus Hodarchaeales archaeon]|jgi:hypothetical protein
MPPQKLLAGIFLIVVGAVLFLLPFMGPMKSTLLVDHTIHEGEINPLFGYQLYPETSMPKKLEVKLTNLTNGLKVRLVVYTKHTEDIMPGDGYVLGHDVTVHNGEAILTFTELSMNALSAIAFKGSTTYYVEAVSENQTDLVGAVIKFAVTSYIPLFIGLIFILIGAILLAVFYIAKPARKRRGKVPFYEELAEPSLPGSIARKPVRKKKKTKKRKFAAPKAEKVVSPSLPPQKCSQCGVNIPSGQMYCPACFAKV